jgi:hypothetical protein
MKEEVDQPNREMEGDKVEAPKPPVEILSDYQKKMREQREKRFGVDRKKPESIP